MADSVFKKTDSVYKNWDDKLGELTSSDFKEGVLKAYAKYRENHAQAGVYQRQQSGVDVTQRMHMGEK